MKNNTIITLIVISTVLFFTCSAVGVGISPAEIRAQNIVGSVLLGTMTLFNTVNESRNMVIRIQSPSELISEQQHLRVICENCHDTHQRYEIINGNCPKCDSNDLIVYERIPDDVLKFLNLEGKDCTLIQNGSIYITEEKYSMREECNIEINIDLPSDPKYSNKHWEVHLSVTTTTNLSSADMGMTAGVQMRLLIDTAYINSNLLSGPVNITILYYIGLILGIIFIFTLYIKRNAIAILINNFQNKNILRHNKLKAKKKSNLSYYFDKDEKNIMSIGNKPIENSKIVKPKFESTNKIKKDNKRINVIEEEIDKFL